MEVKGLSWANERGKECAKERREHSDKEVAVAAGK